MPKTYEKPKMTFVPLENQENIADKCWGNHGTGHKYYDTAGAGFISFTVEAGSCTADNGALEIYYYDKKGDTEGTLIEMDKLDPNNKEDKVLIDAYNEAYNKIMTTTGGSYGQPFKNSNLFPDTPGGMS